MTDCPFQLVDNRWQCPDCDWVYPRFGPRRSPRRNCPNSPDINTPEHREKIKQKMLADMQPIIASSCSPESDLAGIVAQLDQCLTPCKKFNGHACTKNGSKCKYWQRWKEAVAFMSPCRYFEPNPEA